MSSSSDNGRWALELAIAEYAKAPEEKRDYVAVQRAITRHENAVWQDGYRNGQIDCELDNHKENK